MREIRQRGELDYYFYFDAITGIWNRYYFGVHDAEYRSNAERYPVAALWISLGGIRNINENQGFLQGDQYIKSFVTLLGAEFGRNVCYRMDGSEFVVLLEHFEQEDAKAEFEAFEDLLKCRKIEDVSVGYAWADAPESLEDMVCRAEKDMHLNKQKVYEYSTVVGTEMLI